MASASRAITNELGKDAFLKLLIAQLANQDPMNPMDDREFIAQMAQFSALEQMTNMTKGLESLASLQQYSALNYVGMDIMFDYETSAGVSELRIGRVLAVFFDSKEGPLLEVEGSGQIPLKKIHGVTLV